MWIVITTAFIDKLAEDPKDAEVPVGKKMNVTAERGQELIDLRLAVAGEGEADTAIAQTPKAARSRSKAKAKAPVLKDETKPSATPSLVTEEDNHTIAPDDTGMIDGRPAGEDTTHD